ncbi:BQ2448_7469 [Microbotryum intermedium]|uniref:BQ2448_7469 protein n=1 Tax=Microbotryum intermedium TaxID=269621 RepID=A0A238FNG6_9BASI|nr:BQ2448_7469 [Microbotryum intermedium]
MMDHPSSTSSISIDPNRPSNLSIQPSTSSTLQLRRATKKEPPSKDTTRVDVIEEEEDEEEEEVEHEQDIDTYGIAGRSVSFAAPVPKWGDLLEGRAQILFSRMSSFERTWEAAYLMKRYFKPPYTTTTTSTTSLSTSKLIFEPACPFFTHPTEQTSPPRPTRRKRTVVEIGSGTGYLSLHLLPYLQKTDRLIVTDLPEVCPLLRTNIGFPPTDEKVSEETRKRKSSHVPLTLGDVRVRALPWGDEEAVKKLEDEFDLSTSSSSSSWSSDDLDSDQAPPGPGPVPDLILASDLIYFPFLYPGLLRTLIWLTQPRRSTQKNADDNSRKDAVPQVVIGYKIRSLPREEPFWKAFGQCWSCLVREPLPPSKQITKLISNSPSIQTGIWFEFEPVYYRPIPTSTQNEEYPPTSEASPSTDEDDWHRFGETSQGQDQLYIFVCTRRPETYTLEIPQNDETLMNGVGSDDQFETLLLLGMEC